MFLLSHAMLLRGDNVRRIEFADVWALELENHSQPMSCLVINLMGTKTNDSRKDCGVALRNRFPLTCLIGSLAFYLFDRYQEMSWPSFATNRQWYETKLIEVSYPDHSKPSVNLLCI